MNFKTQFLTRISAFLAALCIALAVNGSLLLGFDSMASQVQASQSADGARTALAVQRPGTSAVL